MQAIILAAGMGKRLKELTQDNTKCMVKVNGVTLINRMLHQLDSYHLSRIVLVVGYEGQKLIDYIATLDIQTPISFVNNPIYDKTNNIYSLSLAKDFLLKEDTILLESDLIFEDSVLDCLIYDERDTLALVDKYAAWMDGTCIVIGEDDTIQDFVPGGHFLFQNANSYYKTVNIYKFSRNFSEKYYVPFLEAYSKALGDNEYYEQVLRVITMLDDPVIKAKRLNNQLWYEIDDIQDLDIASSMFVPSDEEKMSSIQNRYGGYWRYPHLTDFCYLVNPTYPPQKLMNEIKASFENLLTQYPSGMRVNSLLAAKNFGVKQDYILVGNGAAELIKSLMENISGSIGLIRPTFEEYSHRIRKNEQIVFVPNNDDYSYSAMDIIRFFDEKNIQNIVLINPDNPSGNYITKVGLLDLIAWAKKKDITLIVDESFVDFADEEDSTLIHNEILEMYDKLIVVKSISKSYGVPGLRLGVLASANCSLIANMKKDVAIWNINSFAEFYLQIEEKYKRDYVKALEQFREFRTEFVKDLSTISGIRVIPSQANFLMVEITNGMSSTELTKRLLVDNQLLIKDLKGKMGNTQGQFVRLAIKNREENKKLVDAVRRIME